MPHPTVLTPTPNWRVIVRVLNRAIAYLIDHQSDQPELDAVADHIGLSPFHTQRLFTPLGGGQPEKVSLLCDGRTGQAEAGRVGQCIRCLPGCGIVGAVPAARYDGHRRSL